MLTLALVVVLNCSELGDYSQRGLRPKLGEALLGSIHWHLDKYLLFFNLVLFCTIFTLNLKLFNLFFHFSTSNYRSTYHPAIPQWRGKQDQDHFSGQTEQDACLVENREIHSYVPITMKLDTGHQAPGHQELACSYPPSIKNLSCMTKQAPGHLGNHCHRILDLGEILNIINIYI